MRLIMLVLIVANIGLFIWSWVNRSHIIKVGGWGVSNEVVVAGREMPGRQIILVGEKGRGETVEAKVSDSGQKSIQNNIDNHESNGADCFLLGPITIKSNDSVKLFLQESESKGIGGSIKVNELSQINDYWVYLKPEATRDLAMIKLKELQGKKIDSFVISDGELSNGISLGVFDKKENAEKRRKEISEMNYEPLVMETVNKSQEIWFLLDKATEEVLAGKMLLRFETEGAELNIRKESCDVVASWRDIN